MRFIGTRTCVVVSALTFGLAGGLQAQPQDKVVAPHQTVVTQAHRLVPPAFALATKKQREEWRARLLNTPRPKKACYNAVYPDTQWHETACTVPPKHYFGMKHGSIAATVGGGHDYVAQPANPIIQAEGSFDSVSGVTSESTTGATAGQGVNGPNAFTLQLNSDFFTTSVCTGLAASCRGFAQFVYESSSNQAWIQYWLVYPGPTCPAGWASVVGDCVKNAPSGVSGPAGGVTIADLADMRLVGAGASGGAVTIYVGGYMQSAPGGNVIPDVASNWGDAEFNVFGDGGGGQAVFNNGSTITVRTQVDTGVNIAPSCVVSGWTAETNNLDLVSTPSPVPKTQYPAIVFDESNAGGGTASCATTIGEPHLTTFDGLYYDFQATGDFVLVNAGPDFIVQGRQESGAVVWNNPNVAMNTAVAAKIGPNRVVIYDSPARVVINGVDTTLSETTMTTLSGGVYAFRSGNVYVVARESGEMVRAQLYGGWMNIEVGLGHRARSTAHGILASPGRTTLQMRDGTTLAQPVSASDLYQRYGKSWQVQPGESLFADQKVKFAAPTRTFFAKDLDPQAFAKAHAACTAAGVTDAAHLEACTLDMGVTKNPVAVKAFTRVIKPHITLTPIKLGIIKQ